MREQFIVVHGIGRNDGDKLSHRDLVDSIKLRLTDCDFHIVKWNDLGFSGKRVTIDAGDKPLDPPIEKLLAGESSPFLFDRLSVLHQIRRRDVTALHPSWTVQTSVHRGELRLFGMLLDYVGDVEVYLRDQKQRTEIQERLRSKVMEVQGSGPVTVISHSLGTLVAYDVIHQLLPPTSVQTLVTLGSPLENLLYLARGFGLITYSLQLDPALDWLNFYDIKDVLATKLVSGDFAREPRDDWLWLARSPFPGRETELIREGRDEVRSIEHFWDDRPLGGLRANIAINRESTAFEAHANYWTHSKLTKNRGAVAELVAGLALKRRAQDAGRE
jgi:pimeloyl-ACP methyl ester carboxylesterase